MFEVMIHLKTSLFRLVTLRASILNGYSCSQAILPSSLIPEHELGPLRGLSVMSDAPLDEEEMCNELVLSGKLRLPQLASGALLDTLQRRPLLTG